MTKYFRVLHLIAAAVLLLLAPPAESFSVNRPIHSRSPITSSQLNVNSLESQPSSSASSNLPSWMDLPSKKEREILTVAQLDGAELLIGRIAMVGAVGIIVNEIFTGASILDQCQDALHQCLTRL
ncbi:hypothetical protein MPSEU_000363700 [Mayamaea pseudoterrestris]|nr:hypothetical protein MPSEU_000363700 [Mayamaea pseudoterrestris]